MDHAQLRSLVEANRNRATRLDGGLSAGEDFETDEDGRRIWTALAYHEGEPDMHRTTFLPGALEPDPNGVPVLWAHSGRDLPVGRVAGWEASPEGPVARFVMDEDDDDPDVQRLIEKMGRRMVDAVSISFDIPNWDEDAYYDKARDLIVFKRGIIKELSLVNVPSSPGSRLRMARSLSMSPDELEGLKRSADEGEQADPLDELTERVAELEEQMVSLSTVEEPVEEAAAEETAEVEDGPDRAARTRRLNRLSRLA